ncbi:mRNA capping enzyme, alpha subunit [Delitschia confertaspora ATCC 74209]|uniref:mRNA-capping enzyme subunit alpha n=1 Tax=Delitschia confertaspora ATCC 74209 TaxID=1513339 RepID=A0A9P4JEL4_9PLEO|nr:mRNA capping enzyme, alpha subunit [Delitschia confertaspora ATCC 74209]
MASSVPPSIPGIQLPYEDAEDLRAQVAELLERDNKRFPGAQPVSFARQHIVELQRKEYFMCEKTDGIRCLLFLTWHEGPTGPEPATLLIDRKNNYYLVQPPLRFPFYGDPNDDGKFLFGTILDGELVHDRVHGQPHPRLIFYVFDCLVIDQVNYTSRSLDKRIAYMKEKVFKPYERAYQHMPPQRRAEQVFRVKEKQAYPPYSLSNVFENILPKLPHGNDGLIFTCKSTPYKFGTDEHILKWKPPHENTIDFKLRLGDFPLFDPEDGGDPIPDYDAMPERFQLLVMHDRNNYQPFQHDMYVTPEDWEILKSLNQRLDGRIIECFRDDEGRWRYKREDDGTPRWRDDKKDANHISTVNSVLESIEDPVTQQDLIAVEGKIRVAVKQMQAKEREQLQAQALEPDAKKRKLSDMNGAH